MSVAETARALGLSQTTVYRRVWDGSLPSLRLVEHGAIRIPRSALDEFAPTTSEPPARAPRTSSEAVDSQARAGDDSKEEA